MSRSRDPKKTNTTNVYGPNGKHEFTSWANAADLVRNCGWTLTKPQPKAEEEKKPTRGRPAKKKDSDAPEDAVEVFASKPNYPDPKKPLESMTRTELLAHVQTLYGVELDGNRNTAYLVWWAQALSSGEDAEKVQARMEKEFGADWGLPGYVEVSENSKDNLLDTSAKKVAKA